MYVRKNIYANNHINITYVLMYVRISVYVNTHVNTTYVPSTILNQIAAFTPHIP